MWHAYCFVDSHPNLAIDITDFDDSGDSDFELDPILDEPFLSLHGWEPKHYFLRVFEKRLKEPCKEWHRIEDWITQVSGFPSRTCLAALPFDLCGV